MKILTLVNLLFITIHSVQASDFAREQRWKEQVVGDLFEGMEDKLFEQVTHWLEANQQ